MTSTTPFAGLKAFEDVGADVLYAPGLTTIDEVKMVVDAVSKPVNVLTLPHFKVEDLAAAGVRRISLGGWLARVATGEFLRAAGEMKEQGTFGAIEQRCQRGGTLPGS